MNRTLEPLISSKIFNDICKEIKKNSFPLSINGVVKSQKSHLFSTIRESLKKQSIFITYSEVQAKKIYDDLKFFLGGNIYYCPVKDFIYYMADTKSNDLYKQRFAVLNQLVNKKKCAVVLSVEALFDRLTEPNYFRQSILKITAGQIFFIDDLSKHLTFLGYENSKITESPGQFSVRGGIFDLCTSECAVRVEFFDNEIDSIRLFDTISQRSLNSIESVEITPMREIIYSDQKLEQALKNIKAELKNYDGAKNFDTLNETISLTIEKLTVQKNLFNTDRYAHFFCDDDIGFLNYLTHDALIFIDEPAKTFAAIQKFYNDFQIQLQEQIKLGNMMHSQTKIILDDEKIRYQIKNKHCIILQTFNQNSELEPKKSFLLNIKTPETFKMYSDFFLANLKQWLSEKKIVILLVATKQNANNFIRYLTNKSIATEYLSCEKNILPSKIYLMEGSINSGFEYTAENFIVVCNEFQLSTKRRIKKNKNPIQNFLELKINDRIVHEKHGVAIYKGLEKITIDGFSKDYLKLEYADAGILFVNTEQMDLIQKYIGGENIKINKLGGSDWHKNKLRVREEIKKIATDLINLYAKRKDAKGFKFSPDNIWQSEFENSFPYEETDDQFSAVSDIKKDMESEIVMDRLICGDVGYGKTEVAMRAAFKTIQDSKQVAYLVPTTILAQQHYNSFIERFSDFPVNIEMLSRFRTPMQQKKIVNDLKSGRLDIIIGTHKLLSDEIKFKDLGLIIVDEEQRFGVSHKEKLKRMRENIDVLTLTATPIPRTLNMSLSGIRDMSLLTEPPHERQNIQTYVIEYNPQIIKTAIENELVRNGQVYYLYNNVKNISSVARRIKELVPNATVRYAHGQLLETELENIMEEFVHGQIDILVCTTIIETGMDIPNVNTIIIQDADKMGLSQLYQLRGRVGRSNKLAYAYLTYKKNKVLTETAEKRLQTIREFTEFGAGFKIAMKDLEIRGAGNLLGSQQHGNIETVGYDLYCKLLNEEIKKLNGDESVNQNKFETNVDIKINAYIPQTYISDEKQKLDMYKKISFVNSDGDYMEIQDELIDRFGNIPQCVQNLLDIVFIKSLAKMLSITSITQKENNLIMQIDKDSNLSVEKLLNTMKNDEQLFFTTNPTFYITYKNFVPLNHLKKLKKILLSLIN